MALDFPSNPTDGQVYGNFYYSASKGAWRSTTSFNTPSQLTNAVITDNAATAVPLTVKGYASQSANLQNWTNSSGTTLASISSAGVPTFPGGVFSSPANVQTSGVTNLVLGGYDANGTIEIGRIDGVASTPYIDFHSSTSASDYNARIMADGGTSTAGSGNLSIQASKLTLPTNTYAPGAIIQVQHVQSSATRYTISAADITAIPELSISFTPKFSTSKILLQAMINSSQTYVCTFGFLKNGAYILSNTNTNSAGSIATTYITDTNGANMFNNFISYVDTPGTTSAITYAAAAASSWAGTNYNLYINDRSDSAMRSISSMTIYEIAV